MVKVGRASEALKLIHLRILHIDLSSKQSLTQEQILRDYQDVFTGLGMLPGTYHIGIDPKVKPVQENPRRVPIPVKDKLKTKMEEIETLGFIANVTKPTPWISKMVAVRN